MTTTKQWRCPNCRTFYPRFRTRLVWFDRGHCAVCEINSWSAEQRAEVEALFNASLPEIIEAL